MRRTADTVVRARIDTRTKDQAQATLLAMGLSISDAIRLLMVRIAEDRRFPFDVRVANAATRRALKELERGRGRRVKTSKGLFKDVGP